MVKQRNVIGEGAYGCVHKPSLRCLKDLKNPDKDLKNPDKDLKNPDIQYTDYVSKIMKTMDAQNELKEFVVIGSYDPVNEYHLGTPILCQPELNDKIIDSEISKCSYIKSSEVKTAPNDYKILLMKFGGPDLKNLCSSEMTKYLSTRAKFKTDRFWLEVHHLLKGLRFFRDNGIVHNDIKPQNILLDLKTGKLAFIDFGLMRSKETIIKSSKRSDNFLGIYHWSYPFDCGLMNKDRYDAYNGLSAIRKNTYKTQLSEMIVTINDKVVKKNIFGMLIKNPNSFNILFSYIDPDGKSPPDTNKYEYIEQFFDGMNELIDTNAYDTVLDRIVSSIDVYGLGFSLKYILNCFHRHGVITLEVFTRLSTFFHKMYDFNPATREINVDALINEYETILLETGILTRLKKSFNNNLLVNKGPVLAKNLGKTSGKNLGKTSGKTSGKNLSPELERFATLDPFSSPDTFDKLLLKQCPPNKELNIVTNRCVKKCKPGQTRNGKFRCVVKKTRKQSKSK
jgi:serine/threonine protein kinase